MRWKNFLSTGNNFTEIQLDRNPTTLIIGENGAGKSTILDALCFGLFGKPFRNINKAQLLNTVNNSSALVEIEFKIGTKEIKVRRVSNPTCLKSISMVRCTIKMPTPEIIRNILNNKS